MNINLHKIKAKILFKIMVLKLVFLDQFEKKQLILKNFNFKTLKMFFKI